MHIDFYIKKGGRLQCTFGRHLPPLHLFQLPTYILASVHPKVYLPGYPSKCYSWVCLTERLCVHCMFVCLSTRLRVLHLKSSLWLGSNCCGFKNRIQRRFLHTSCPTHVSSLSTTAKAGLPHSLSPPAPQGMGGPVSFPGRLVVVKWGGRWGRKKGRPLQAIRLWWWD